MSENVVVALHGGEVSNERRERFVQSVAASFEKYVKDYGVEPDAIVYVMCGIKQTSMIGWDITGESRDGVVTTLALAAIHMTAEAADRRVVLDQ